MYNELRTTLKASNFSNIDKTEATPEKFCDGATCEIDLNGREN
jgi:hypothetical protein